MTADAEQYLLIIGSMKSGTTTLFSMLADHPKIAPAHPKEPGFFAFDHTHAKGVEWYHDLFQFDPGQHRYRLDGSTDYTKAPFVTGVRERMAMQGNARFKLIYIMRHPLRRIESHARHVQSARKEIGQLVSARVDHSLDSGVSLESLSMGRYAQQLDVYKDLFDAGELYLTTLEELKTRPAEILHEITEFLGIEPHTEEGPARHANIGGTRAQPRKIWAKLTANPIALSIAKRLLGQRFRNWIKSLFRKTVTPEGRFELSTQEEQAILDLLHDDLVRLRDLYGVDVERLWRVSL